MKPLPPQDLGALCERANARARELDRAPTELWRPVPSWRAGAAWGVGTVAAVSIVAGLAVTSRPMQLARHAEPALPPPAVAPLAAVVRADPDAAQSSLWEGSVLRMQFEGTPPDEAPPSRADDSPSDIPEPD